MHKASKDNIHKVYEFRYSLSYLPPSFFPVSASLRCQRLRFLIIFVLPVYSLCIFPTSRLCVFPSQPFPPLLPFQLSVAKYYFLRFTNYYVFHFFPLTILFHPSTLPPSSPSNLHFELFVNLRRKSPISRRL